MTVSSVSRIMNGEMLDGIVEPLCAQDEKSRIEMFLRSMSSASSYDDH